MFSDLVHEECIAKMRLLSLLDLASDVSGQIPYALIKDTLRVFALAFLFVMFYLFSLYSCLIEAMQVPFQINDDEVELWVVKAITAKLIDCKIDQMNQVVLVRCVICLHPSKLHSSFSLLPTPTGCSPLSAVATSGPVSCVLLVQ